MSLVPLALVLCAALVSPARAANPERPEPPPRLERGPVEVGLHLGTVVAAPTQRRWSVGVDAGVRLSDLAAIELTGSYAHDFGQGSWTPTTRMIIEQNNVSPKLAHVFGTAGAVARFMPFHGAVGANDGTLFDVYSLIGVGIAGYQPSFSYIQCGGRSCAFAGARTSPTATLGVGVMVARRAATAVRVELRATTLTLSTEDGHMFRRDEAELRLGVSWGGQRRGSAPPEPER